MELRVLRYFLAVAREESITAAAERLHVTQPTLSKQLMDLEGELGKQLFIRGSRKITLTREGRFLRERAQEMVDLADRTQAAFQSGGTEPAGDVSIGGGETEGMRYLAQAADRVHQRCPDIRFHLFSGNGEEVAERLDGGLLDFGLFVGQVDLAKYAFLTLPTTDAWGLLLRKDHPLAAKAHILPEDLRETPLLLSRQLLVQNQLSGWLGCPMEELHSLGSYNLLHNAALWVEEGVGCALCIDGLADTSRDSGLCFRPLFPPLTAGLTVAWKKFQVFSPAAGRFLEEMRRIPGENRG